MQSQSEDVRMRVLNALYWDLAAPRHRLSVDVENGWVTVSGMVDLPYQRTCANRTLEAFRASSASPIRSALRRL